MNLIRKIRPDFALPSLITLAILTITAVIFSFQRSNTEVRLAQETRLTGSTVAAQLQTHLNARLKAGALLGQRFVVAEEIDAETFRAEAALTHALFEDFQALSWVDAAGVIRIVTPEEGNEAAINLDLRTLPLPAQVLARSEETGRMQVTPPIELAQGGRGFVAYVPVSGTAGRTGFVNIVFRTDPLFENVLMESGARPYALNITDAGKLVFATSEVAVRSDIAHESFVMVGPRQWRISIAPTASLVRQANTWLDEIILAFGVLAAVLSGLTSRLVFVRQAAVQKGEARLRDIANNIDDVVWVGSADNTETRYINPAFERVFGLSFEQIKNDPSALADILEPDEAQKIFGTIEAVSEKLATEEKPSTDRFEYPIYKVKGPDGITRDMYARGVAMRDENGQIDRFVNVATDVTELIRTQEDLRNSNERLLQSQKMEAIGQLTGGVAHDFNNLLAVILGNIELAEDADLPDEIRKSLSVAKSTALKGAALTKSLLSFARQSPLEPARIDINKMVKETESWSSRVIPEIIEFEASLLDSLWKVEVDPTLTQSALLNLILNARDAMPDGGKLTLETSNVRIGQEYNELHDEDIEPGHYVLLSVSDTGTGIHKENLAQVFDPFFTTKPVGAGSGLGLSMVQGFMKQSGGFVRISSEQNVGTTLKLYFKAVSGEQENDARDRPASRMPITAGSRILVVEDEEAVLDLLVTVLTRAGHLVTPARSGDEALKIWDEDPSFDIVVTDIVMPGSLQGTDLARALREGNKDLPVVFLSGYASEATVYENRLRQEDIRLMKPVTRNDLLVAVEKAL